MSRLKTCYPILMAMAILGCTREFVEKHVGVNYTVTHPSASKGLAPLPGKFVEKEGVLTFHREAAKVWSPEQAQVSSKHHFVKYTNSYRSKTDVDFEKELIKVSTLQSSSPKFALKKAIVATLLTPTDIEKIDMYSDADIELGGEPFLYKRVRDQDGKPIRWRWRAEQYANYLIETYMKTEVVNYHTVHYVEFPFIQSGELPLSTKDYKYASLVRKASQKYKISESLIYAIIRTESSFNPYAVSHAGAFGLMQVIPSTAGADVYKLVKGSKRNPTRKELMTPSINVDVGTAYLMLLNKRYLKDIENPIVREYAVISSYNGGTGGVFRAFGHRNPKAAIKEINKHSAESAYKILTTKHPFSEARNYLVKVNRYKKEFIASLND